MYLLKYIKPSGMTVEAIRQNFSEAIHEAKKQYQNNVRCIVCYFVEGEKRTRAFWLINYKICYIDKNGKRGIINSYKWSFEKKDIGDKIVECLNKSGFKYAKYYEQPFPLIESKEIRMNRYRIIKNGSFGSKHKTV